MEWWYLAAYFNRLQQQDPRLSCIRHGESDRGAWPYDDGYGLATGNGYYGAYQFLVSTWRSLAAQAGRPDLVGIRPDQAAWWDQDAVTFWAVTHGQSGHWHGTIYCNY